MQDMRNLHQQGMLTDDFMYETEQAFNKDKLKELFAKRETIPDLSFEEIIKKNKTEPKSKKAPLAKNAKKRMRRKVYPY